ncbi:MAG: restriction endonuclease subunit S [Thermodesulfobacteriota bacterium]
MPDKWKEHSLIDLIEIKHGFAFSGEYFRDDPQGDILLTPGNFFIGGGFKDDKFKYYVGPVPEEFVLNEGDLLITMTDLSKEADTLGYPAIIPKPSFGSFLHNQRLGKVLIKDGAPLNKRFLYYLLRTKGYRHEVMASATGTTVKHTSPNRILAFKFKLPPPYEQQAIAHILGTIDDKIELNRRMNETLEAMARAIFKSWFVDFDPVKAKTEGRQPEGLDADTAALFPDSFEDSELGEIPKGWNVCTISSIADLNVRTLGANDKLDVIEYIEISKVMRGEVSEVARYERGTEPSRAKRRLTHGDTVLSTVRPDRGAYFLCLTPPDTLIASTGFVVVTPKNSSWAFLHAALTRAEVGEELGLLADGGAYPAIRPEVIGGLSLVTPRNRQIVDAYERISQPLFKKADHNRKGSLVLAAIRDALLPKLLSGEIRVKDAERWVEAQM